VYPPTSKTQNRFPKPKIDFSTQKSISQTLNRSQSGAIMGYSSMYTVNQDDLHPVVGETSIKGLWACNGFSGHGFKLAPAIGSMVAQQVTLYPKPQTPNPKSYTLYPTPLGLL